MRVSSSPSIIIEDTKINLECLCLFRLGLIGSVMALMKAIQINSPGSDFELVHREVPKPKENEVLIKVEACGVCHGDAIVKEGHFPGLQYPRIPGHEVVGIIDQLGVQVKELEGWTESWRRVAWRTLLRMSRMSKWRVWGL
jgi:hypothetical protein